MKALLIASILAGLALPAVAAEAVVITPTNAKAISLDPKPQDACAKLFEKTANGDVGPLPFKRLDQLPKSHLILAVLRTVEGCPVTETRFGGVDYYIAPSIPVVTPAKPVTRRPVVEEVAPLPLAPR